MQESYDPNKLSHNEPFYPISEWQEFNTLNNERDWREIEEFIGGFMCQDLPIEAAEVIEENFWELLV